MKYTFYLLLAVVLFQSCSPRLTPLTDDLVRENRWSEDQMRQIQFYLSENVTLSRQLGGSATEITSGEIKVIDGRKVEQVVIAKGTPGIALFSPKKELLAISFEAGSDKRFLVFGPSPKMGGRYVLRAKEWNRRSGRVTYDEKLYRVDGRSAYATLMVDLKKISRTVLDSRKASGRTIK